MFEKLWKKGKEKEGAELNDQEAQRRLEIEKIYNTIFTVEAVPGTSLASLITSAGVTDVDSRITEENFPNPERSLSSSARIVGSGRDSFVEDTVGYLHKDGQHPATVYDLLEFIPQCPESVSRLYALGSLLDEDDKKFCVKIEKKEGHIALFLEQLGSETYRDGITHYYTPWPASLLAVKDTPTK